MALNFKGETSEFDNENLIIGARDSVTGSRVIVQGSLFVVQDGSTSTRSNFRAASRCSLASARPTSGNSPIESVLRRLAKR